MSPKHTAEDQSQTDETQSTEIEASTEDHRKHGGGHVGVGTPTQKALNFGPSLKRVIAELRPERMVVTSVIVLGAIGVLLTVIGPKLLGAATDVIFAGVVGMMLPAGVTKEQAVQQLEASGQTDLAQMIARMDLVPGQGVDTGALGTALLIALAAYAGSAILMWVQGWLLNGAVQRTIKNLREKVELKLHRLPLSYFDKQPRGELLSRVTNDIDNLSQVMQQTFSQLLTALLTLIGVLVMMFVVSPTLALVALIIIPLSLVTTMIIGKQSQKQFVAQWAATGKVNSVVEESYSGHALVKVFGRSKETEATFEEENEQLFQSSFKAQFISGIIMPVMFLLGNIQYVAIAVLGGVRVATGQMNLGDIQAFIQYTRMFTQPLTQVASMANLLQSGVASAERVFEVLDATEQVTEGNASLPPVRGRVVFEHVAFSYTDEPLITDLSLTAEPGQTVAIVGPTGAGKTTLVNLIMRFYELDGGRITLDNVDVSTVPRPELRSRLGMVLQDTWLFHGTIAENIAYGRPGASREEIEEAGRACLVDRFVHSLPDGYDTMIDEEGSNVSAGEKQLITIARAFLADPALLILDEATSSVDTRTEVLVQEAMNNLRRGRTSFVIAHRLSTIRDADVILVMRDGGIVEQGSHSALLEQRGPYWELYNAQFAGAIEDAEPEPELPERDAPAAGPMG
ncbi:ABC transporter ATP-binding protein [Parenemella sanctibonifatiensis]|uniref:Fatty acid ABC transporter ATP-binding/permease protein n=1 Tax=Parenemella sanctibonifatiensis TaxID=2016505 RepID=A0A255EJ16_9ACTN|nr:ABC transporter ATP-binding protein [Parenemella sanctibonifatiensis]OYN91494.1 multidrug ABC transporter ATP-binding protein [Parenemella sanctibonifatiensis]